MNTKLSPNERRIADLLRTGKTSSEIAAEMDRKKGYIIGTIRWIRLKQGCTSTPQLIVKLVEEARSGESGGSILVEQERANAAE